MPDGLYLHELPEPFRPVRGKFRTNRQGLRVTTMDLASGWPEYAFRDHCPVGHDRTRCDLGVPFDHDP